MIDTKVYDKRIHEIKENKDNPRSISKEKFEKLVKSIKDAPWMLRIRPLVIDSNNIVLGGNMRLKACREAGMDSVPVISAGDLTDEQKKEFIVKDNVGYGDWDLDALANDYDLKTLDDWGLDLDIDIEDVSGSLNLEKDDNFDVEKDVDTDIVVGDLFDIGKHRLLCGDSTNPQHVDKLLSGESPCLMVTDPPYGVEYDASWRNKATRSDGGQVGGRSIGKVMNDDNADWSDTFSLSPSKIAYIYHAGKFSGTVQKSLEDNEFSIVSQIIWSKSHFAISRSDYHWKHEPCWYAVKKGAKHEWIGDRKQTTVWEIDKPTKNETGHSTQKPVECMKKPISNHSGDVYDPFMGSGTTMVAAHSLNRRCFGIELNPKYCQIIINRMLNIDPGLTVKKVV